MAKSDLPDPFTAHACERLRSLMALRNKQVTKKANATAARDSLMEAISECTDGETTKMAKLKVECFDEERAIEKANKAIKTCEAKVYETIEKGDEPTLFELLPSNVTLSNLDTEIEDPVETPPDAQDALVA